MTPVELSRTVLHAVRRAVDGGELSVKVPERVVVGRPGPGGCGDYATGVALQLARPAGQPPLRVAGILRTRLLDLGPEHAIEDVVVTPPGFLNIRLRDTAPAALVAEILRCGVRYGHATGDAGRPSERVLTLHAPLEVRALVVMDVAARLLRAQGTDVRTVTGTADDAALSPEPHWVRLLGLEHLQGLAHPQHLPDLQRLQRLEGLEDHDRLDATTVEDPGYLDGPGAHRPPGPRVDTAAPPATSSRFLRPVPAPADPTFLGRDAARWALLHPAGHDRPRLGDEHLAQRESNPLFRVRYAHARTRALIRNAADLGFTPEPDPQSEPAPQPDREPGPGPHPGTTEASAAPRPVTAPAAEATASTQATAPT
ncbi:MAG TPA: hypothetical protein VFP69_01405, partial [Streptomyces sp.]|nr:hypothetical protein [Streptomyces sp.]